MQLTNLQEQMVDNIFGYYNPQNKSIVEFKSPTGSGKTLMASSLIARLIESGDRFIFIIATPSSADLPKAFESKLNRYKIGFNAHFEVEYIKSPSSSKNDKSESIPMIKPERNKVYIFGKASFGKNRILSEYGIIDDFIKSSKQSGYKIIYIRDEAHIGTDKVDSKSDNNFEKLLNTSAHFILKMTATPSFENGTHQVTMSEKDLNNETLNDGKFLLKTSFESILDNDVNDNEVLETSIKKFKDIQQEYKNAKIGVNPAMLIQVDNEPSDMEKKKAYRKELENIKKALNVANLSWIQYFGDDKDSNRVYKDNFNLENITKNNNDIDVIIFKIGPATGWDIPRACMLVQLRNVSSTKLNTQTIGRIKRNPYPNLEKNEVTDKYYLFSNFSDNEVVQYQYKVRDRFKDEKFLRIEVSNAEDLKASENIRAFKEKVQEYLSCESNKIMQRINARFVNGVYKKIAMNVGTNVIYSNITNAFVFLKEYKKLINTNKFLYDNIADSVKEFAKKNKKQSEFVMTILLDELRTDLNSLLKQTRKISPKYEIKEESYNPLEYREIYSKEEGEKINKEYLFDIKSKNGNRQILDSKPERIIYDKLFDSEAIKIWAKNLTTSNIYGEYLDDENSIKRSYFDFIVLFENGVYLYIEVKSNEKDIDSNKTKLLESAYDDYFKNTKETLFEKKLVIMLCRVDSKKNYSKVFYNEKQFKEDLNKLDFEEQIKAISQN
ncbi:hypothetical protein FMM54_08360 [Campylobacter sp. LR185c]|uniref:DEAD/DEAH box helicase n=1 Tax=Campylobacter sp. LR185c TaxID=2014525 RepID=UPI001237F086|nr:DEAD/DEAH box helicase family protein [Campylobacter sp. LR185c]KAA6220572.1 hypothetical protein FMM54_08360 [Campylobacter sp. LR185c]KAA8604236.1 hypothetical protein CGP82_03340 [Campylobacter sp. LR185c]